MIDTIINGDTLTVLRSMESESIDCVITSPPYWGLRDYGIEGQLGLEPTFNEYITNLQTIFDEVYRVLKRSGTLWCDMGDTYANNGNSEVQTKSLCNIPFRFAISMTDHNWIQRNTIIWHKPSCMPSSAKDRFTVDFEYVFFFTKNKKYWFEQQFEALSEASIERMKYPVNQITSGAIYPNEQRDTPYINKDGNSGMHYNPNGRNKRTVWRINPQPFREAHFAVFPEKLVAPMIKAGCPSAICDSCGEAYATKDKPINNLPRIKTKYTENAYSARQGEICQKDTEREYSTTVKKCNCNAPTHAGVVLDPFSGSGTTCIVARKLGRHYIGIDLQSDYCDMARKRLSEVL